jgi:hypothetical protein
MPGLGREPVKIESLRVQVGLIALLRAVRSVGGKVGRVSA